MSDSESSPTSSAANASPHFNAWTILIALVVLTAISWASEFVTMGPAFGTFFVIAIAACKAFFVLAFFMHLKFEGRWKWVLIVPPVIMAILMVLALVPDIAHHS